ncbi:MAG: kinase [Sphingomonas bacterium]|nr:kinase [Sphingomonas bacterium]MDB5689865.1 kinase [Sphingomonas bacterium]
MPGEVPSAPLDRLIEDLALPADFTALPWYRRVTAEIVRRAHLADAPLLVGLCGSQGSGKSTMAAFLRALLDAQRLPTAILSIDDLYLDLPERVALAGTVHPLLRTRGVPGTHDIALGQDVIGRLFTAEPGAATPIPRFDKATDSRAPEGAWERFIGPARIVILEGWCIGATPQTEAELAEPVNALEAAEDADGRWRAYVNAALAGPYRDLFARIDLGVFLRAPIYDCVFEWRRLQEEKLRARTGGSGAGLMDDAALARFIMHYERITRHLLRTMPGRADLIVSLGADHQITGLDRAKP